MPLSQSRTGQIPCSTKVCRNLFGPVDHQELQNDFGNLLRQHLEEAQQRWNFNFETDTPLEGQFKWERVFLAEELPQEVTGSKSRSSLVHKIVPKDHLDMICPEVSQQSSEVYRAGSPQSLKRGQTTMKAEDASKSFITLSSHGLRLSSEIKGWGGSADFYSSKRRIVPEKPKP